MVRRVLFVLGMVAGLGAVAFASAIAMGARPAFLTNLLVEVRSPIVVGLIHSQTGPLAISEKSLLEAEVLALEEINAEGGVAGRLVKWEVADGRSDPSTFATQAARLIERDGAVGLFGGWTAECRKAMVAVVEERDNLLVFPANYEGIEQSRRVVYVGGSANQVVLPAVRWCFDSLKARKFFVVGTEEVWSRCASELAKDGVKASSGSLVGEVYLPLAGGDSESLVGSIRSASPDVVLNLLVGESNLAFYAALRKAGSGPEKLPVMAFNVSEDELRRFPPVDVSGHYAAWNYFQSIDRDESREFVRRFKAKYGESRPVSDAMVAAYNGVRIWAKAAADAGSGDPSAVLAHLDRQSLDAPEGVVTIDPESHIAWRPFFVGRVRSDGQFDVAWSITKPIHPVVFVDTRSKGRWLALLDELKARWNGRWSSSEPIHPNPTPPAH
jgi:urea transport system substrate-binding protein